MIRYNSFLLAQFAITKKALEFKIQGPINTHYQQPFLPTNKFHHKHSPCLARLLVNQFTSSTPQPLNYQLLNYLPFK